jgi:hypothetical protein
LSALRCSYKFECIVDSKWLLPLPLSRVHVWLLDPRVVDSRFLEVLAQGCLPPEIKESGDGECRGSSKCCRETLLCAVTILEQKERLGGIMEESMVGRKLGYYELFFKICGCFDSPRPLRVGLDANVSCEVCIADGEKGCCLCLRELLLYSQ